LSGAVYFLRAWHPWGHRNFFHPHERDYFPFDFFVACRFLLQHLIRFLSPHMRFGFFGLSVVAYSNDFTVKVSPSFLFHRHEPTQLSPPSSTLHFFFPFTVRAPLGPGTPPFSLYIQPALGVRISPLREPRQSGNPLCGHPPTSPSPQRLQMSSFSSGIFFGFSDLRPQKLFRWPSPCPGE